VAHEHRVGPLIGAIVGPGDVPAANMLGTLVPLKTDQRRGA
jgi:hypothetical protein